MDINSKLKKLCSDSFKVDLIDVTNESYLHNTSVNSESHFKLILVSDDFIGLKIIDRHKKVHLVLSDILNDIHALSLHLFTIEEFKKNTSDLESPECVNKK